VVGTLGGVDPDAGQSATLTFSLPSGVDDNAAFNISGTSLRANASFDFDVQNSYTVTVRATDSGSLTFDEQFTITVLESEYDFGDAPSAAQSGFLASYPTLQADDGARHLATGPTLGAQRESDSNGQPTLGADGDDLNGTPDDEDGVTIPTLFLGANASLTVNVQGSGARLDAWLDFNQDGDWDDAGEQIATNLVVGVGDTVLSVNVPPGATAGSSYARFRLSSAGGLAPTGEALDGEVEDYLVSLEGNDAPTDIGLSSTSVREQQPVGTIVGSLSTVDADLPTDSHTYSFVSVPGIDNAYFEISGSQLLTKSNLVYATRGNYQVRIRTTDSGGLFYDETFAILVVPDAPIFPPAVYTNGFSGNLNGWDLFVGYTPTLGPGYAIVSGSEEAPGKAVTDFGGYRTTFPASGFVTSLDLNLDTNAPVGSQFAWVSSVLLAGSSEVADGFAFTLIRTNLLDGTDAWRVAALAAEPEDLLGENQSLLMLGDDLVANLTNSGWYTLQQRFYPAASDPTLLAVDFAILDSNGGLIANFTLTTALPLSTLGGNAYGAILGSTLAELQMDNSQLSFPPRPVALGTKLTLLEDEELAFNLQARVYPASAVLEVQLTRLPSGGVLLAGNLPAVAGTWYSGSTVFSYQPAADWFGITNLHFLARDGAQVSASAAAVTLTVLSVNDAPQGSLNVSSISVGEDSGSRSTSGVATLTSKGAPNESSQTVTVSLVPVSGSVPATVFSVPPTLSAIGTLNLTPKPNAHGVVEYNVTITDNGAPAAAAVLGTLVIEVYPVNDTPTLAALTKTTMEDAAAQTFTFTLTDADTPLLSNTVIDITGDGGLVYQWDGADDLDSAGTRIANLTLSFSGKVGTATMTLKPDANTGQGNAQNTLNVATSLNITVTDAGDADATDVAGFAENNALEGALQAAKTMSLSVTPVNDQPGFRFLSAASGAVPSPGITALATNASLNASFTLQRGAARTITGFTQAWANESNHADTFEAGQSLTYTFSGVDFTKLVTTPTIDATGKLTINAKSTASGPVTLTVVAKDNGTGALSQYQSVPHTLTVTIVP
jgi:hypothetical protein